MIRILYLVLFSILLSFASSSQIHQSYAQVPNLEDIEIDVQGWQKIEFDKSDILALKVSFTNSGNSEYDIIIDNVLLVNSEKQTFSPWDYLELEEKEFLVSSDDCPAIVTANVNPGFLVEENLCYEIPKGTESVFSLEIYDMLPDLCAEPIFDCNSKSFLFTLKAEYGPEISCLERLGDTPILIFTDKENYDQGDTISVSGCLSDQALTKGINIVLYDPEGNRIDTSTFVANPDRTFSKEFVVDEKFGINGTYFVEVDAGGLYSTTKSFVVPEFGSVVLIIMGISFGLILINKKLFKPISNFT